MDFIEMVVEFMCFKKAKKNRVDSFGAMSESTRSIQRCIQL